MNIIYKKKEKTSKRIKINKNDRTGDAIAIVGSMAFEFLLQRRIDGTTGWFITTLLPDSSECDMQHII